jgi:thiol-disulfide isomerase/thioredoxin
MRRIWPTVWVALAVGTSVATKTMVGRFDQELHQAVVGIDLSDLELLDAEGRATTLGVHLNPAGLTVVVLWASWCVPCRVEIPKLVQWQAALNAGQKPLRILILALDTDAEELATYLKKHPFAWPYLRDPSGQIMEVLSRRSLPYGVVVDPAGLVVDTFEDPGADVRARIEAR